MKFSYKKSILKTLICFVLLFSLDIHASIQPWYKSYCHTLKGIFYTDTCFAIDLVQKIKYAMLTVYYRGLYNQADLDQVLTDIQNELIVFQEMLIEEEKSILISIKEKYGMDEIIWQECLSTIDRFKKNHTDAMTRSHHTVHDKNIPDEIMHSLTNLLKENGINPDSIDIRIAYKKEIATNPSSYLALARQTIIIPKKDTQNNLVFDYTYIPAKIIIFPTLCNKTIADQISCCAHEIQHLVSFHIITDLVLSDYLEHYCSVSEKEFNESLESKRLHQNHEAQAEILSAINSPHIASVMKQFRHKYFYPDHLYEEHFYHLAKIDTWWKLHNKLESIYFA